MFSIGGTPHIKEVDKHLEIMGRIVETTSQIVLQEELAKVVLAGGIMTQLRNSITFGHCQVFELEGTNGTEFVPNHIHEESDEYFIMIKGQLEFSDGKIIKTGEIRIIPKGVLHGGLLSEDCLCILVLRPPETTYSFNDEQAGGDGVG